MTRAVIISAEDLDVHHAIRRERMAVALTTFAGTSRRGLQTTWKIVSAWYL